VSVEAHLVPSELHFTKDGILLFLGKPIELHGYGSGLTPCRGVDSQIFAGALLTASRS
jgi:hypothetical protein